jgi:redox-sensitive bicupin YhaK (pirin superfamily)
MAAGFAHVKEVPVSETPGTRMHVFAGMLDGTTSPAPHYSEVVGTDIEVDAGHSRELALEGRYEHAVLVLSGDCALDGQALEERVLYYLGTSRSRVEFSSRGGGRCLLVGGPPFPETILMWWNFVGRTAEEIAAAREDWEARRRFGEVKAYVGPRLSAPSLAKFARPNPVS